MSKTPEELAWDWALKREVLVKLPYCKDHIKEAVTKEQLDTYLAGYQAGLAAEKWISTEEQLPKDGQYVIVPWGEECVPAQFELHHQQQWTIWSCPGSISPERIHNYVEHWQPLPAAPNEEK